MPGILDDDEDITIDDLFIEPLDEEKEETEEDKNKKASKELLESQKRELQELKEQLNELKNKQFSFSSNQQQEKPKEQTQPTRLKDKIKQKLESNNFDIAEAMEFAANEAFNAGQLSSKAQYVPVAAQAARYAVAKFLDDNPMTVSARKEFDKIINETTDEQFASFTPQQLSFAIETAANVAEGIVIRKTKNTRGAEPPMYSNGNGASFGRESVQTTKPKITKEERQAAELARDMGFTPAELKKMFGGTE